METVISTATVHNILLIWNFALAQVYGEIQSSFSFAFNPNTDPGLA